MCKLRAQFIRARPTSTGLYDVTKDVRMSLIERGTKSDSWGTQGGVHTYLEKGKITKDTTSYEASDR